MGEHREEGLVGVYQIGSNFAATTGSGGHRHREIPAFMWAVVDGERALVPTSDGRTPDLGPEYVYQKTFDGTTVVIKIE